MPEWIMIFTPLAACITMLMAVRLVLKERGKEAEDKGASSTALAHSMSELRTALNRATEEIAQLRNMAKDVLTLGIELGHVKASIDDIRDEMKLLADAERVHSTLHDLDKRMRDVEQHLAKWSGVMQKQP